MPHRAMTLASMASSV